MVVSLNRRDALAISSAAVGAALITPLGSGSPLAAGTTAAAGSCRLYPQSTAGPYYFDPELVRSDITEGRPGLPVELALTVTDHATCTPIVGARVDIWHADAGGVYSGYPRQGDDQDTSTAGMTYLRGTQLTDPAGAAVFRTIYPGWYPGRTPHIHLMVYLDDKTVATGQIYFDDGLSATIYRDHPSYAARPVADMTNDHDGVFRQSGADGSLAVIANADPTKVLATLAIAIDSTGESVRASRGWGGWLRAMLGG